MTQNPLIKNGIVATPESMEALRDYLALFHGNDAVIAQTTAGMAWNLASKIIDEAIEEEEEPHLPEENAVIQDLAMSSDEVADLADTPRCNE